MGAGCPRLPGRVSVVRLAAHAIYEAHRREVGRMRPLAPTPPPWQAAIAAALATAITATHAIAAAAAAARCRRPAAASARVHPRGRRRARRRRGSPLSSRIGSTHRHQRRGAIARHAKPALLTDQRPPGA